MSNAIQGLSESDVLARRARGQGNNVGIKTGRSYWDILRQNLFTFMNIVLFAIGAALVALRLYSDALLSVGIVMMNVVIGMIQEVRAKRMLDRIALLTRPKATVIRESKEKIVDPTEIVVGDILVVNPGDQIVVDGEIVGDGKIDVDESLLTGESDLIPKRAGDKVFSGSFCVNGKAMFEAQKVGAESTANKMTAGARAFRQNKTPLQHQTEFAIRMLIFLAASLGFLLFLSTLIKEVNLTESAKTAAVIGGLVPNGLFFMITIAYAMGALRIAGRGALIQQSNAVESMSNINVLCMDKTGTLTANKIIYHNMQPLTVDEQTLRRYLGDFAASGKVGNRTSEAIAAEIPGAVHQLVDEVPFSSARKWSAVVVDDEAFRGVFVLGAPEMLQTNLDLSVNLGSQINEWADKGLRVLLFAHRPEVTQINDEAGQPHLPANLIPLGLISFSDELRPEVENTLRGFAQAGIRLKIISGDNPQTVAALAKQAGLASDIKVISGLELAQMDDTQVAKAAEENTVFGRITPEQKEKLVQALIQNGHYVAMMGDGVNDVLSLKKAKIGIAMQSGSQATRGVADIVLLNDSFAALPPAFQEGQRILNGMQDIMRLFLTRALYVALIIVGALMVNVDFPYSPKQVSLLSLFTVGLPTFALAAWARPGQQDRKSLLSNVLPFIIPAAVTLAAVAITVFTISYSRVYDGIYNNALGKESLAELNFTEPGNIQKFEDTVGKSFAIFDQEAQAAAKATARTVLTAMTLFCGLLLIIFVEPPTQFWVGGDEFSGDWRPTFMALILMAISVVILAVPDIGRGFDLGALQPFDIGLIAGGVAVWFIVVRLIWRGKWYQKFITIGGTIPQ